MIDANYLKSILHYDPETGSWTWIVSPSAITKAGSAAGYIHSSGYLIIQVKRRKYRAHRLAYLYMNGEWPPFDLDHKDTDKSNCRWSNLRPATRSENGANRGLNKNNTSGRKGVTWDNRHQKWHVRVSVNGASRWIGYFDDLDVAAYEYEKAAKEAWSEFARAA